MHHSFLKGSIPWNKGTRGIQIAWNRGVTGAYKHSPEAKAKIIKTLIGRPCSKETREKMRVAQRGKFVSQSSRAKMSVARKGHPAWNRGITYSESVRERMSIGSQGKNAGLKHWNWRGGVTPVGRKIRESTRYKKWRKAVFERDDYRCFDCGGRGVEVEAHHIYSFAEYPRLRFEIENGITLCTACHRQTPNFGRRLYRKQVARLTSAAVQIN